MTSRRMGERKMTRMMGGEGKKDDYRRKGAKKIEHDEEGREER